MYKKLLPWYIDQTQNHVCIKDIQNKFLKNQKITLLNWNVYKNNYHTKWLHDFSYILHTFKPNLITFQEYKTKNKNAILDKHIEYGYGFFPNIKIKQKEYGLINASTSKIDHFRSLFSSFVEPLAKTPKISFCTKYKLNNSQTLTLVNTHMINFVSLEKYINQIKQIEKLCYEDKPIILCGDFNTWSQKRLSILKDMTKSINLYHVEFQDKEYKKKFLSNQLDHVFYKGLKPLKTKILHSIKTSDHKPMIVEFDNFNSNLLCS